MGIYVGIMLVMFLYNFFIYLSTKDQNYLYYILYIIPVALAQTYLHGYPFKYLWPNFPEFEQFSAFFLPALAAITALRFIQQFLQTKVSAPLFYYFLWFVFIILTIAVLLYFTNYYKIDNQILLLKASKK